VTLLQTQSASGTVQFQRVDQIQFVFYPYFWARKTTCGRQDGPVARGAIASCPPAAATDNVYLCSLIRLSAAPQGLLLLLNLQIVRHPLNALDLPGKLFRAIAIRWGRYDTRQRDVAVGGRHADAC
jgi:hypothetical protein